MTTFTIYTANTTGAQQNTVYPNEVTVDNLSALEQAMRRDHVCAKYTGNVRGVANFQYADCIPMAVTTITATIQTIGKAQRM